MTSQKKITSSVIPFLLIVFYLIYFGCHSATNANPTGTPLASGVASKPGSVEPDQEEVIESISLIRRNWESHGTDTRITSGGRFLVEGVFLGNTKKIREGSMARQQWEALVDFIRETEFSNYRKEYAGPFKTEVGWWGYEVTVQTNKKVMSVRFHSEDETVPRRLKDLAALIMEVSK